MQVTPDGGAGDCHHSGLCFQWLMSLVGPGMRLLGCPPLKSHYRNARHYFDFNKNCVSFKSALLCCPYRQNLGLPRQSL